VILGEGTCAEATPNEIAATRTQQVTLEDGRMRVNLHHNSIESE